MKNKPRHQKFFTDKFHATIETHKELVVKSRFIQETINKNFKSLQKKSLNKNINATMTNSLLKELLMNNGLYKGTFYVNPWNLNHLINLNLEEVHCDFSKLNKRKHNQTNWGVDENEFKKIYVLDVSEDGYAIIALTYTEIMCDFIIVTIPVSHIALEGNMAAHYMEIPYSEDNY